MNTDFPTSIKRARINAARWALRACVATLLLGACSLRAQSTNGVKSGPAFNDFNIILQRNIFDPNRRAFGRIIRDNNPRVRPQAVDAFALVGTMSYPKGKFAFFDGSSYQYKKVLQPGGNIIGYTVKDVTTTNVLLAANGKDFSMPIGSQLRKDGQNGAWRMSTGGELPTDSNSNADQGVESPAADFTPPEGSSAQMTEILRRLAQQRESALTN